MKLDVVIPAHIKDIDTIDLCIEFVKKNVIGVNKVFVISKNKLTNNAIWISENLFSFTKKDIQDFMGVGNHWRVGWYYAGLIKLHVFEIPNILDNVLVLDCDTLFLKPTKFLDEKGMGLFNASPSDGTPVYLIHMKKLLPNLEKQHKMSGISHHILMNREIVKSLFKSVEERFNQVYWKADLGITKKRYGFNKEPSNIYDGPGRRATYEIYFNYALQFFPQKCRVRLLNSILAYKGRIPVKNDKIIWHHCPSRTNKNGLVQIISEEEEKKMKLYKSIKEALRYLSEYCKKKGYDNVTFQNHTRIGIKEHKKINIKI
jgi:hypothetical protein